MFTFQKNLKFIIVLALAQFNAISSTNFQRVMEKYFSDSSDARVLKLIELADKNLINIEPVLLLKGRVDERSPIQQLSYIQGRDRDEINIPVYLSPHLHLNSVLEENLFSENLLDTNYLELKSINPEESLSCVGTRVFRLPWKDILEDWVDNFFSQVHITENQIIFSDKDVIDLTPKVTVNLYVDAQILLDISSEKVTFTPQTIYFDHNSSKVNLNYLDQKSSGNPFEKIGIWLQKYLQLGCNSNELVYLTGHADSSGGARARLYNQQISLKRAQAVEQKLKTTIEQLMTKNGTIDSSLFVIRGAGTSESYQNGSERNKHDRRVEIDIDPDLYEKEYITLSQPIIKNQEFSYTIETNDQYEAKENDSVPSPERENGDFENEAEQDINFCINSFNRKSDQRLCLVLKGQVERRVESEDVNGLVARLINNYHRSYFKYQFMKINKPSCRFSYVDYVAGETLIRLVPTSKKKKKKTQISFRHHKGFMAKPSSVERFNIEEVDIQSEGFNPNEYFRTSLNGGESYFLYPNRLRSKYLQIEIKRLKHDHNTVDGSGIVCR